MGDGADGHRLSRGLFVRRYRVAQEFHLGACAHIRDLDGPGFTGHQGRRMQRHFEIGVVVPLIALKAAACSSLAAITIWHGTVSYPTIAADVVRCWPSMIANFPPATGETTTGAKHDQENSRAMRSTFWRPLPMIGR